MTDTTSTPIYAPVRSDIKRGDIKVCQRAAIAAN